MERLVGDAVVIRLRRTCSSGRVVRAWPPTCVGGSDNHGSIVLRHAFSKQFSMSASLAISDENGAAGWGRGCDGLGRPTRARPPTYVGGSDKSGPGVPQSAFSEQFPMSGSLAISDENGSPWLNSMAAQSRGHATLAGDFLNSTHRHLGSSSWPPESRLDSISRTPQPREASAVARSWACWADLSTTEAAESPSRSPDRRQRLPWGCVPPPNLGRLRSDRV